MKRFILKAMAWAAVALVIPLVGNQIIDGWNWSLGDFVFAWVFLVIMSMTVRWAAYRASSAKYRVVVGAAVFAVFVCIWILLATG